jgi:hypothetical protein
MSPEISNQIVQLVFSLLAIILTGLAGMALKALNAYVGQKIGDAKWLTLKDRASMIVAYLAQCPISENWENGQKKQYALIDLIKYAEAQGISIVADYSEVALKKAGMAVTRDELDRMIEEAVAMFKKGLEAPVVVMPENAG